MSEFGSRVTVEAPADQVFQFVCDPRNMPRYLPTLERADWQGHGRIQVAGEVQGHRYESDGWFDLDPENMMMTWGSDGENRYSGRLSVTDNGKQCDVEVKLHFEPRPDQDEAFRLQMGSREASIQQGLDRAMMSIKQICEGNPSKVPADLPSGKQFMS